MSYRATLQRWEAEVAPQRTGPRANRRTALKALSVPVFAAAMSVFLPAAVAEAAPAGCHGLPTCSCCSGRNCCFPKCYVRNSCDGGQCWYTCSGGCGYCCDWTECDYYGQNCHGCICKG